MCGVAGIVRPQAATAVDERALLRMAGAIRHRGPDGFGLALDAGAGLVSTRLSIFDLPRGWQPLESGPGGSLLVYNGEVYNHPELRSELSGRGRELLDDLRHRGRAADAGARGRRVARPVQRPVRVRLVAAGPAALDAGPGSLRRAPALLRAGGRWHPGLRLRGQGALRLGGGDPSTRSRRNRRGVHALGPTAAAHGVSRRQAGAARRAGRLGARKDRRGAPMVGPRVRAGRKR